MRHFWLMILMVGLMGCMEQEKSKDTQEEEASAGPEASAELEPGPDGWISLFDGKNLDNFVQRNGEAPYTIENGAIVGTAIKNTPNSFLCTKQTFGDFILELEFKVDSVLNSGIQFRSLSQADYRDGRVHGYQCEIDPSPRAYTAGIYDEARRGWLYPLSRNEAARQAFKQGEWNKVRIQAIGPEIITFLNGQQAAHLLDDLTPQGFIALQVHSIHGDNEEQVGAQVRWRNIRIKIDDLEEERIAPTEDSYQVNLIPNHLSDFEKAQGWKLLWDGKTTEGWRSSRSEDFPEKGWVIEDGILSIQASGGGESVKYGDIITEKKYGNFALKLDFMLTEGANSGIKYTVDPELNQGEGSEIGLEYQLLDDKKHPDAKKGVAGNRTLASLYDLIPATNLSVPSRGKPFNGIGSWNHAYLMLNGNHVEHWLNEFKVVQYERRTQMYRALVAYSKYAKWPDFGEADQGHILLQDHGNLVHFRSIKIKELP